MDFRTQALLSMNRALWDLVTADLRGVALRASGEMIACRMLYASPIDDEHREIAAEVETYAVADFPASVQIEVIPVCVLPPERRELEQGEEWLFLRKE